MNVLFFQEPKTANYGGVTNVEYNLPRALAKYARMTYYPAFNPRFDYSAKLFNIYERIALKDFHVAHFCVIPALATGGYLLFKMAKLNRASIVLNIHGIIQIENILYDLRTNWFWGASYKGLSSTLRYCRLADKIVTYSEFMKKEITKWYRINPDKITVIPNGVEVTKFSQSDSDFSLEGDPAILYLGSLAKFKSPDVIINALPRIKERMPNLKLHLVGPGDAKVLNQLAIEKGVEKTVVFHGSIPPRKAPSYYKAADLCVFPSRRDTAGITLFEAMASGTPVIASNRGGTPEIITNGENGLLFEPDDLDSLQMAVEMLVNDSKLRDKLSKNAFKTVEFYSWENIAKKYVALYNSMIK